MHLSRFLLAGAAWAALAAGPVWAQPGKSADPQAFMNKAEADLATLSERASRLAWIQSTYITDDTRKLASEAGAELNALTVRLIGESKAFVGAKLPYDLDRKFKLLRTSVTLPAPNDPKLNAELANLDSELGAMYATGKVCEGGDCRTLDDLEELLRTSRDPEAMKAAWVGWHKVAEPMKDPYTRLTQIANAGSRELGYADTGELWRSGYDMPPAEFAREVDRLWDQVKPLYEALHCHVRAKLGEAYGTDVVPQDQPIPAHLLGNMWAQSWVNVYDLVAPPKAAEGYNLTKILNEKKFDAVKMTKTAENFFTSLGLEPLPDTFWTRSMLTRPQDREVVCHASAWNIDAKDDIRVKMCMRINGEDFDTIHHELGHNFYQRAYKEQPLLYQNGAHDGFHEAIGDFVALSITPSYLKQIGLIEKEPGSEGDLGLLMERALEKVAFLPFGLLVDKWRWQVFSGEVQPANYNEAWWKLRQDYQGVQRPVPATPAAFDPGAKNHVPTSVPYMRYFLSLVLQFQFHKAACEQAGYQGPLHRCSIYGNGDVGKRFKAMMEMGASRPWPEALKTFTGTDRMDAAAVLAYFEPLRAWLDQQNKERKCGW